LNLLEKNKLLAPKTHAEIIKFINEHYVNIISQEKLTITSFPDDFLIGVYFKFFELNNIDFSVSSTDLNVLMEEIMLVINIYETSISHYS
jgi:hypothetical protein